MADQSNSKNDTEPRRIKLAARLSPKEQDAITELQRQHRRQISKSHPPWRCIEAAIINDAQTHGIGTRR